MVEKMTGFDFGPPEYITSQLGRIIESEDYQHAVKTNYREQPPPSQPEKKRGVFDFYKRRNSASRDTLSNPSAEVVPLGNDPLNAYSPLLSIYHMVKEKLDRERQETKPGALGVPTQLVTACSKCRTFRRQKLLIPTSTKSLAKMMPVGELVPGREPTAMKSLGMVSGISILVHSLDRHLLHHSQGHLRRKKALLLVFCDASVRVGPRIAAARRNVKGLGMVTRHR